MLNLRLLIHFLSKKDKNNVNTRLFIFRKLEQTILQYGKFDTGYNGPILRNDTDDRFKILTSHSFKENYFCISSIPIKLH